MKQYYNETKSSGKCLFFKFSILSRLKYSNSTFASIARSFYSSSYLPKKICTCLSFSKTDRHDYSLFDTEGRNKVETLKEFSFLESSGINMDANTAKESTLEGLDQIPYFSGTCLEPTLLDPIFILDVVDY